MPRERILRKAKQLPNVQLVDDLNRLEHEGSVLIVDSGYVVETRALQGLLPRPNVVLRCPTNGRFTAARDHPQAYQGFAVTRAAYRPG